MRRRCPDSHSDFASGNKSEDPKVKLEVFTDDDCCGSGAHHQFYCGKSSTVSFLGDSRIRIKQEYDHDELACRSIWDTNKVQKKKRSKLARYSLSPLERLISQLHHVPYYGCTRPYKKSNPAPTDQPKYDDVLIYQQQCMYVAENEVGLGAKLLSSPPLISTAAIREECSSTNGDGDHFSCLIIDVPVRSTGDSDQ